MESKENELELNDKIPKERRIRTKDTKGEFDEDGFFTTPNGSFWDMDGEYFNHFGFDIHGGKYIDKLDYIPGPGWIEELGCYPEDKDKYQKEDDLDDDIDMGLDDEKNLDMLEGDGDFGLTDDMKKLGIKEDKKEDGKKDDNLKKENNKQNKNKKNKKKKEECYDEDEWEEIED